MDGKGFLPHEVDFINSALGIASAKLAKANEAYGEAVASSGGDWALDDPACKDAAMDAHFKEQDVTKLRDLQRESLREGTIDYPSADSTLASFGSRVLVEMEGDLDWYELVSHSIPGLRISENVLPLSPHAPLGIALFGAAEGDVVSWVAGSRTIRGTVVEVDQIGARSFYE